MFLLTVWSYCKRYWFVAVAIIGFVLFEMWRSNQSDLAKTLADIQKSHDDELKKIQDAHDLEEQQHQQNEQQLQAQLALVEKQAEDAQKELDDTKRAEIKQIIKDTQGDPVALAQKLSDATGFQIVIPTD